MKRSRSNSATASRIGDRIAAMIVSTQKMAADFLNRKTAHWNKKQQRCALAIFCLFSVALYAAILYHASSHHAAGINISTGNLPQYIGKPVTKLGTVSKDTIGRRLLQFADEADSSGTYDSLCTFRAGLLDSIRHFIRDGAMIDNN